MLIRVAAPRLHRPGYRALRLNRSHRLLANAAAVVVMGAPFGLGREMFTGARLLTSNNAPTVGLTEEGPAFTNTNADDQATTEFSADIWNVTGDITVAWRGLLANNSYRYIGGKLPAGGGGGSNTPFSIEVANPTAQRFALVRSNAGGFRVWEQNTSIVTAGVVQGMSVSQGGGIENAPTFYINGVADSGATSQYGGGGTGAATTNTTGISMGRRLDGNNSAQFHSHILIVARGQWTADEHLLWALAPWGVLEDAPSYHDVRTISSGTVYNETIADAVTGAESFATRLVAVGSISDATTAAESNAVAQTIRTTLADEVTAAEASAASQVMPNPITDDVTGGEAFGTTAVFNSALSDGATAADSVEGSVSTTYNETIADAVTAVDVMEGELPNTGDTHDGFKRRTRRQKALDAAERKRREDMATEARALRLSLEAAMGMAAEAVEKAPPQAAEALQEATEAARVVPAVLARQVDWVALQAARDAVAALHTAIEAAARAKALADDDEDVEILLRAL